MADTKNFPPWTPKDELLMAKMEVARLEKLTENGGDVPQSVLDELVDAYEEVAKWEAQITD